MDGRSGLRADALLLHHHHRRRRRHVLGPVLSPVPPLPFALHRFHAETAEERRENNVRGAALAKGNDGLDLGLPLLRGDPVRKTSRWRSQTRDNDGPGGGAVERQFGWREF